MRKELLKKKEGMQEWAMLKSHSRVILTVNMMMNMTRSTQVKKRVGDIIVNKKKTITPLVMKMTSNTALTVIRENSPTGQRTKVNL